MQQLKIESGFKKVPCPLCGSNNYSLYTWAPSHYGSEKYSVTKCIECGMIFTNPQLDTYVDIVKQRGILDRHFSNNVIAQAETMASMQLFLLKKLGAGRSILDYGCGSGTFVHTAIKKGWDAIGYDLNLRLVEAANRYWKIDKLHTGSFEQFSMNSVQKFDAIISNQVLEHIQNPLEVGKSLVQLLKPNGLFYIDVPYVYQPKELFMRGITLDPTAHWCHFSKRTLVTFMSFIGCKVIFKSAAPSLMQFWVKLKLKSDTTNKLSFICKKFLPSVGTGIVVIGKKN